MNIVSAMNSAYSYMNNVTIGFTEDQITYFKLLTKPLDDSMEQENNGTDSQITVDNTAKTSYFSAKYIFGRSYCRYRRQMELFLWNS